MVLFGATCRADACGLDQPTSAAVITYQREEIRALREMLGGKRLRFTDEQRRRLALKAQAVAGWTFVPDRQPGNARPAARAGVLIG